MVNLFNPTSALIAKFILVILFIISGALKLPNLKQFYYNFLSYDILKGKIAKFLAYSLPFGEIVLGLALITGLYSVLLSSLALAFLLINTFAVIYALYKKKKMDNCGCYGALVKVPLDWKKLVENIIWVVIALYLLLSNFF